MKTNAGSSGRPGPRWQAAAIIRATRPPRRRARTVALAGFALAGLLAAPPSARGADAGTNRAATASAPARDASLMDLDLDALANMTITSVSKKEQRLSDTAAAVTVLTGDDVHRSGAQTLPEALRLVPGLHVAQIGAATWAITSRGFNSEFANKLLVMIDGRSVYTPLFSGVYWDVQDVLLEDIDRIEVIRGPGATVWGANAVNGVINVVTKSARDTQQGLVYGGGGTEKQGLFGTRYGFQLNDTTWGRVYAKYGAFDDTQLAGSSRDAKDAWHIGQGGFRIDHEPDAATKMTWQGDGYAGRAFSGASDTYGANTLGRWSHRISEKQSVEVQAYYDRTHRVDIIGQTRDTADATFQHNLALGKRNQVTWGLGYRFSRIALDEIGPAVQVVSESMGISLYSGFVQDEFQLVPDKLIFTAGTKIEHNDFTGWEVQPSGRLAFKPTGHQTVWAAVSRAVRTPSEVEGHDLVAIPLGFSPPNLVPTLFGNERVLAEELMAYELGYRIQPTKKLTIDVAAFYNDYDDLTTVQPSGLPYASGPVVVVPTSFLNGVQGHTYGGEATVTVSPYDNLRVTLGYALMFYDLESDFAGAAEGFENSTPRHQVLARVAYDLSEQWRFDVTTRYVDAVAAGGISSYLEADARVAWQPTKNLEVALIGQNLLRDSHREYDGGFGAKQEIERGGYLKVTYRF